MTNSEKFKVRFPDFKGAVDFYTLDSEQLNFIDVENDKVEFTVGRVHDCGCCSSYEEDQSNLMYVMDNMRDDEFEELCEEVAKQL